MNLNSPGLKNAMDNKFIFLFLQDELKGNGFIQKYATTDTNHCYLTSSLILENTVVIMHCDTANKMIKKIYASTTCMHQTVSSP